MKEVKITGHYGIRGHQPTARPSIVARGATFNGTLDELKLVYEVAK